MDFISSDEFASVRFNSLGNIPPKKFDLDTSKTTTPLMSAIIATQSSKTDRGANFQRMPGSTAFSAYQSALDEFCVGGITAEELIADVQEELDETVAEE